MKAKFFIQNLKCVGCVNSILKALNKIDNIENISVDEDSSLVSFDCLNEEVLLNAKKKLYILGYPAEEDTNTVFSKAKSFISCASGRLSKKVSD